MKTPAACVFIVDDDEAVRSSVRFLIRSVGLSAQVYASAPDFLSAYDPRHPGCLLLDVRMPGMSGLELQQELNRRGATIPVVFITGHGDVPMAVEAMQQGAFDFLQKPFRDQDLLDRVQRALARDAESRARLAVRAEIVTRLATLTPRETEVLQLVTRGKANKVVGAELGVSQRTVEIHRAHVMEKMNASSLAELVRMVLDSEDPTHNP
jgi:two-component system response regulator FixJ